MMAQEATEQIDSERQDSAIVTDAETLKDRLTRETEHPIRLPVFEGPLDLLLFLIRRNEIDIYDIPIETVTRQYLEVLNSMERLSLEVAGEFFVMAATLMQIKSRMLLPREKRPEEVAEGDEEGPDPRWELVQQLLEYRRFKEAANLLGDSISNQQDNLARFFLPEETTPEARPLKPSDRLALWNTFNLVLRRLSERIRVGEIHEETVTVADRMEDVLQILKSRPFFRFTEIIEEKLTSPVYLVASFLAILELVRLGHLEVSQSVDFEDIDCRACKPPQGTPQSESVEIPQLATE